MEKDYKLYRELWNTVQDESTAIQGVVFQWHSWLWVIPTSVSVPSFMVLCIAPHLFSCKWHQYILWFTKLGKQGFIFLVCCWVFIFISFRKCPTTCCHKRITPPTDSIIIFVVSFLHTCHIYNILYIYIILTILCTWYQIKKITMTFIDF